MSHERYVTLLAHYQPLDSPRGTGIPAAVADFLVSRLVAEKITQRIYRMLHPSSIFSAAKVFPQRRPEFSPEEFNALAPVELPGLRFILPNAAAWRLARHAAAVASLGNYVWAE